MIRKTIFDQVLKRLHTGSLKIDYWGEEEIIYGKGNNPIPIYIKDKEVLSDILKNYDIGFAEAYMDGRIEIPKHKLLDLLELAEENVDILTGTFGKKLSYKYRANTKKFHTDQIQSHYDRGNDFYKLWLDKTMTYSCAYFKTPKDSLEQAQTQKIDYLLKKLQLKKDQELLDIGCGWGDLIIRAAKKYRVKGLGVTLSREQYNYARKLAKQEGVENLAKFKNIDYLDLLSINKQYDRIISVGFYEHVGKGNHKQYFDVVNKLLKPGGVSVLHAITHQTEQPVPPFIDKYIFPGGYIPSLRETVWLISEYKFRIVDIENLRAHYVLTLTEWLKRFETHVDEIRKMYDERFVRMWRLYLAGSIASFEKGHNELSQIIFTKGIDYSLPLTRAYLYKD